MLQLQKFGVIRMYEKITNLKKKIQAMKKSRLQTVYNQIFKFKPFSKKQKQVLTWWCATSPVKDYDGIIADGAIRSGKTVCMSLSYVMWAMETFNGQEFCHVRENHRIISKERTILAKTHAKGKRLRCGRPQSRQPDQ